MATVKIDPRVLRLLPPAIMTEHKVVPISFANNRLRLAMSPPGAAPPAPRIRALIGSGTRSEEIHAAAIEEGMIDLKRHSAWLLTEGLTSVAEVTSVVSVDI